MAIRNYSSTAADTTLTSSANSADTSLDVAATTGFPAAPFILALEPDTANQELVLVTGVAGTTLTVTRGYDATVATTHASGAAVRHSHGAIDFREPNTHVNATSGVHGVVGELAGVGDLNSHDANPSAHGVTGEIVGTEDAQTLKNKTFDSSSPSAFLPPGVVVPWGGFAGGDGNAPTGWLVCRGQAVSRATYAALFAAVGTSFGSGDGSTTFNVPDLREAFPRGAMTASDVGSEGGATHITLSVDNLPAHSHGAGTLEAASAGNHTHTVVTQANTGDGSATARGSGAFESTATTSSDGAHTHEITGSTASVGSGASKEVTPPYVAFDYIIKA